MTSSIINSLPNTSYDIYFEVGFMRLIEDHLAFLRVDPNTEEHAVDPNKALVYEGDLYGYLKDNNVPFYLHWITLRLNKLHTPTDFKNIQVLLIPNPNKIENLMAKYRTRSRIN